MNFKSILCMLLVGCSTPLIAETIVGEFAPVGYVGPKSNTLTMIEAHTVCLNESGVGYTVSATTTSSFETVYRACMKEYTPFRATGEGLGGDCVTESVTWGQCGGVVNSGFQGISSFVANTSNTADFEGYANYMCVDNKWVYLSGGCSRTANTCDAGLVTQWGVTFPLWADVDPDTVYTDKYGKVRHIPKENCAAEMESHYSGDFVQQYVTSPETDLSLYNSKSNAPFRCFDAKWSREPIDAGSCTYEPKSCSAQSVSFNGCSFDIPELQHDEVYIDGTPNPFRSVGHTEAYCFDGKVEIKSQSCLRSCDTDFKSRQWLPESGTDAGQCAHNDFTSPVRMPPNSTRLIDNEQDGMSGNITYTCSNGSVSATSSTCKPKSCDSIAPNSWTGTDGSYCEHDKVTGYWDDGESVLKDSELDLFFSNGYASYVCEGGNMTLKASLCFKGIAEEMPCISHEIELPPEVVPDPVDPMNPPTVDICEETYGSDYLKLGQACCTSGGFDGGLQKCYQIP